MQTRHRRCHATSSPSPTLRRLCLSDASTGTPQRGRFSYWFEVELPIALVVRIEWARSRWFEMTVTKGFVNQIRKESRPFDRLRTSSAHSVFEVTLSLAGEVGQTPRQSSAQATSHHSNHRKPRRDGVRITPRPLFFVSPPGLSSPCRRSFDGCARGRRFTQSEDHVNRQRRQPRNAHTVRAGAFFQTSYLSASMVPRL